MLGLLDLSLLPLGATESIDLQKGGNSAMWGSGAIGGVLSLNNRPNFSNKFSIGVQSEIGSFGFNNQQLKFGFGNKKFQSITTVLHQSAKNDFSYPIAPNFPERQNTNADYSRQNILQNFYWQVKPSLQLAFHFWGILSEQGIPPKTTQNQSLARQRDEAIRSIFEVKKYLSKGYLQGKVGYFDEYNIYESGVGFESNNHFTNLFYELEGQWNFNDHHRFVLGSNFTTTKAESPGYIEEIIENRQSFFSSYMMNHRFLKVQTSLRQTLLNGKAIPIIPSLGWEIQALPFLKLQSKISRNFRLPTLNDRYWSPGGNSDLQPESGWSQELGFQLNFGKKNIISSLQITGFNRNIGNWIMYHSI
jgi:iron complex outermembrane receptor protein